MKVKTAKIIFQGQEQDRGFTFTFSCLTVKVNQPYVKSESEKFRISTFFRGRSRMEEWQLGPPLLVGDRVVHLGEVAIMMDMMILMTPWGTCCPSRRGSFVTLWWWLCMYMVMIHFDDRYDLLTGALPCLLALAGTPSWPLSAPARCWWSHHP